MLHFFIFALFVAATKGYTTRIVHGTDAELGEFPSVVALGIRDMIMCGASIIDELHILTAAHCVEHRLEYGIFIKYGMIDKNHGGSQMKVSRLAIHPSYDIMSLENDIAVLKLQGPIAFDKNSQPVKLPERDAPTPEEKQSILVGWGLEYSGGRASDILQKVDLKIFTDEECENIYANDFTTTNRSIQLCSGVVGGGKGQCSGDSGGPLYVDGTQVGIVSWSVKPCARAGKPGVFTKVSAYIDWINEQIEALKG